MKPFLCAILLSLSLTLLHAQSDFRGRVFNETNLPLSGASVEFKNPSNKQTIRVVTDSLGNFLINNITTGSVWKLKISLVGYDLLERSVEIGNNNAIFHLTEKASNLEPLEVSAVRASEKAPFAKTDISSVMIQKQNLGRDLPYILDQTPNVVVNSDAGNGIGYTGIHIRGSDGTRTNVTINGIPYNDAESSGAYFVDLPDVVSSVGSIQIQRGVGTSSNGAGAFGATVNLSTNELHDKAYANINNSYGSFNSWKNTVMAGSGLIDGKFTADIRLSHISSDGYIDRAASNLQSLLFSGAYIGNKTTVKFNFISGKEKTYQAWDGVPEEILPYHRTYNELGLMNVVDTSYYKNETDNYLQNHYQLFLTHQFNKAFSFSLATFLTTGIGYYEEYKMDQGYGDYGLPGFVPKVGDTIASTDLIRRQYLDNDFYGQTFSFNYNTDQDALTLGGSWTDYDGKHYGNVIWTANGGVANDYRYYYFTAYKYDKNIYAKWMHHFGKYWQSFADLQYRNVWHKMNGFQQNPELIIERNFNFVNPKIGLSYFKNGFSSFLSYAIANKEPNRDDFEAGISSQPKKELLQDFEFGLAQKDSVFSWGANLYYMLYKDQLVLTGQLNDVGGSTRVNVPNSYRAGIELQAAYRFTNWLRLDANFSASRNKIKSYTAYYNSYDDNWNSLVQVSKKYNNTNIAFSPDYVGAATLLIHPMANLDISFIAKYVGDQYLDNTQDNTRKLLGYYNQDAQIGYTFSNLLFRTVQINFKVFNIFNHYYNSNGATYPEYDAGVLNNYNYYYPMAGTNFLLGLNMSL